MQKIVNKQITIFCLIIILTSFLAALLIQSNHIISWRNIIILIALLASTVTSVKIVTQNINKQVALCQNEANLLDNQIIANISHELKTPLTAIIGYTQCVLDGYDGEINSEQQVDLERVIKNAMSLSRLIDDMVDLSRVGAGKIELSPGVFSFEECVNGVIAGLQAVSEENVSRLNVDIPDDLPPILMDLTKVRRVLLNAIQSALEYTRRGVITILARASDQYYAEVTISSIEGNQKAKGAGDTLSDAKMEVKKSWLARHRMKRLSSGSSSKVAFLSRFLGFSLSRLGLSKEEFADFIQPEFKVEYKSPPAPALGKDGRVDWGLALARELVNLHTGSFHVECDAENGANVILFTLPLATPGLRKYIEKDLNENLDDKQREIASKIYKWLDN